MNLCNLFSVLFRGENGWVAVGELIGVSPPQVPNTEISSTERCVQLASVSPVAHSRWDSECLTPGSALLAPFSKQECWEGKKTPNISTCISGRNTLAALAGREGFPADLPQLSQQLHVRLRVYWKLPQSLTAQLFPFTPSKRAQRCFTFLCLMCSWRPQETALFKSRSSGEG